MEKYLISLDWLELHCRCYEELLLLGVDDYDFGEVQVFKKELGTRFFRYVYEVRKHNKVIATLTLSPRASFINQNVALLKLENYVLYSAVWYDTLVMVCNAINLQVRGITRLDVCYDCLRFANGRKPHRFIKDYISKDVDDDGFIHRYGSNKFSIEGERKPNEHSRFSYIRFGSRKSAVQCYIYNKSKELREVKEKPYIRMAWEKAGLCVDGMDVWRTEISIKSQGCKVVDVQTGELFSLLPDDISREYGIQKIFHSYAKKYLRFARKDGQKLAKDYTPIRLFEQGGEPPLRPRALKKYLDTGRAEKIVVNKLRHWSEEYCDLAGHMVNSIQSTIDFFVMISGSKEIDYKKAQEDYDLQRLSAGRFLPNFLNMYREFEEDSPIIRRKKRERRCIYLAAEKNKRDKLDARYARAMQEFESKYMR